MLKHMDLYNVDLQNNAIKNNGNIPPPKTRCEHCEILTDGIKTHLHD